MEMRENMRLERSNYKRKSKITLYVFISLCFFTMTSCSKESVGNLSETLNSGIYNNDFPYSISTSTIEKTDTYVEEIYKTEDITAQTVSYDYVTQLLNDTEFPVLNIYDYSTDEEVMLEGKKAATFYSERTAKFFKYGVYNVWKLSNNIDDICYNDNRKPNQSSTIFEKSLGLFVDPQNNVYIPMNGDSSKQFLISFLGLTERGYEELCEKSPSTYIIKDGNFYVCAGDGGLSGWDYSRIIGYEIKGNTITYYCEIEGEAEVWGYDENKIWDFSFRLAYEDNIWKLDGISCSEGFFCLDDLTQIDKR